MKKPSVSEYTQEPDYDLVAHLDPDEVGDMVDFMDGIEPAGDTLGMVNPLKIEYPEMELEDIKRVTKFYRELVTWRNQNELEN